MIAAPARLVAIPEEELDSLKCRLEALAVTVDQLKGRANGSDDDLLSPKEVGKRFKIDEKKVYAACRAGRLVAEQREAGRGGKPIWLITAGDARKWWQTFIRGKVNQ